MSFAENITTFNVVIAIAAAALGALLVYLLRMSPRTPESPILVRDGSMVLESEQGTLEDRFWVIGDSLVHLKSMSIRTIRAKSAAGALGPLCTRDQNLECTLLVTYSNDSTVLFRSPKGHKNLFIRSKEKPFAGNWKTDNPKTWICEDSVGVTTTMRSAVVKGTDHDGDLCTGGNCELRVILN